MLRHAVMVSEPGFYSVARKEIRLALEEQVVQLEVESRRPKGPVPVFSQCVVGYREWRLYAATGQLCPASFGVVDMVRRWQPGVNEAVCGKGSSHKPPRPIGECTCGLHAYSEAQQRLGPGGVVHPALSNPELPVYIFGAVVGWGDVEVHCDGWRAEKAQIVAIADTQPHYSELVARRYKVPLVPLSLLQAEAERHGSPLPEDVVPEGGLAGHPWRTASTAAVINTTQQAMVNLSASMTSWSTGPPPQKQKPKRTKPDTRSKRPPANRQGPDKPW